MPKITNILFKGFYICYLTLFQYGILPYSDQKGYKKSLHDHNIAGGRGYWYKHLPMRVGNSPYVFQEKFNDLFQGFDFLCTYIYSLIVLTKVYCTDHLETRILSLRI